MGRSQGATHISKILRQEKGFDLLVKGAHLTEIAAQLGCSIRTIQRDLAEKEADLQRNDDIHKLRTWARADAEYASLWRECNILLHTPALHGNDNLAVKLRIIDLLREIADSRNNLAFAIGRQKAADRNPAPVAKEETVAAVINLLPPELRDKLVESIRKRVELEKSA